VTPDLFNWLLVFLRATAMLVVFPIFSAAHVPKQIRVALGAMIGFLVAPILPPMPGAGLDIWGAIGLMSLEVGFGLILGFVSRMFLYALEIAGSFMAMEMGLTMPGGMNPVTDSSTTEVGTILQYLGMMLFLTLNLHHGLLVAFQRSYAFLPIGGGQIRESLVLDMFARTSQLFAFAVQMSAPVLAVCFLVTLIFSVLGRAVPQMNVFTENFGVRLLAGLTVFGLTCHLMAEHVANFLGRLPDDVLRVAQLLGTR
jgi:flagellar biosynthetic protein FliR